MNLFQLGSFTLHSGEQAKWKIECDALTDADIRTLAVMLMEIVPRFRSVDGVPRGGLRLAAALEPFVTPDGVALLVDDVLTTGTSMRSFAEQGWPGRQMYGAVLFARGPCPIWIKPLFQMW